MLSNQPPSEGAQIIEKTCHCEPVLTLAWQPVSKAFPSGEGGSRVSRKRETDEGRHTGHFLKRALSKVTFPE